MIRIDTDRLNSVVGYANDTAEACLDYSDALNSNVIRKIDSYSGENTSNIVTAETKIREKQNQLRRKAEAYQRYSLDVENFKEKVESEERRLKGRIESLFGEFAAAYDIDISKGVVESIVDFFGELFGIDDLYHDIIQGITHRLNAWDTVKTWYRYQGGKEIVKCVTSILIAVLATIGAIVAIFTAGWIVATIIAVAAAIFATINAIHDTAYLLHGIGNAMAGDTHLAGRDIYHADTEGFKHTLEDMGLFEIAEWYGTIETIVNTLKLALDLYGLSGTIAGIDTTNPSGFWKYLKEGDVSSSLKDFKDFTTYLKGYLEVVDGILDVDYAGDALGSRLDFSGLIDGTLGLTLQHLSDYKSEILKDGKLVKATASDWTIERIADIFSKSNDLIKDSCDLVEDGFDIKLPFPKTIGEAAQERINRITDFAKGFTFDFPTVLKPHLAFY